MSLFVTHLDMKSTEFVVSFSLIPFRTEGKELLTMWLLTVKLCIMTVRAQFAAYAQLGIYVGLLTENLQLTDTVIVVLFCGVILVHQSYISGGCDVIYY